MSEVAMQPIDGKGDRRRRGLLNIQGLFLGYVVLDPQGLAWDTRLRSVLAEDIIQSPIRQ
ncbi:hypothetical protein CVT26_010802 [Gymnopilus dilepis]|uniref:Uncharacterized protein n=1 Tax=Gymnopilus dilepis TaxID=231916 RepID=A0A409VIK1_9AGAR|nr:hypothetical protein CVT26_010802 [Gymnopilus dilepis]